MQIIAKNADEITIVTYFSLLLLTMRFFLLIEELIPEVTTRTIENIASKSVMSQKSKGKIMFSQALNLLYRYQYLLGALIITNDSIK